MTNQNKAPAMARVWAGRRAWQMAPECCCGCSTRLEISKDPARQKYFAQGHDTRLKSILRKFLSGEMTSDNIPQAACANLSKLKFVRARPEFRKAFTNPSQRQLRVQAKVTTEEPAE
jgi:hypothetical protein